MSSRDSLMDLAARLVRAIERRHGDGLEALMALARTLGGVAASVDRKPVGDRQRRIKRRKPRATKKAAAPIAAVVQKEIPRKPAPLPKPPPLAVGASPPVTPKPAVSTIVVRTEPDNEAIEHAGQVMEITGKQAALLAMFAKASPLPIGRPQLIARLWPNASRDSADAMLGGLVTECRQIVPSVGLVLVTMRGVGIALQPAEPDPFRSLA